MVNIVIQRFDYEWVDVTMKRFVRCCDCGLVHKEEYRIVPGDNDDHIIRQAVRDKRATAACRRSLKMKKEGLWKREQRKKSRTRG